MEPRHAQEVAKDFLGLRKFERKQISRRVLKDIQGWGMYEALDEAYESLLTYLDKTTHA